MNDSKAGLASHDVLEGHLMLAVRGLAAASRVMEVIEVLRRSTKALVGARGVTVVARQDGLCHYLADDAQSALWPDQRFPMEACISGWAMLNGAPAVIRDIHEDERIPQVVYEPTFVKSLIMTPIGEHRAYAAFGAYWDHVRDHPRRDVEVLETLASCAASALERIWLAESWRAASAARGGTEPVEGQADLLEALMRHEVVSELQKREAELEDAHRRLNAIVNNATVAIFLMDEHQRCAYMNAAAEKLTGYTLPETMGRALHDVVHHTRPDGTPYPLEECPIDRAFPERAQMQGEEIFVHRDGSFYPVAFTASPILDEESRTIGTIIEVQDISAAKAADAQRELLMHEVDHRSRNALSVAQALVRLTNATDPKEFKTILTGRIDALARAQASLAGTTWQGASLRRLVVDEVRSLTTSDQIHTTSPDLMLETEQVQPICMILHELATNAVKHGSLSAPHGRVEVRWTADSGRLAELEWIETGGPQVARPSHTGFGSQMLRQLAGQLGAKLKVDWRPTGLCVHLRFASPPASPAGR